MLEVPHRPDFTIDQSWNAYTAQEHGVWRALYRQQAKLLVGRAAPEFLAGMAALPLGEEKIPDVDRLNEKLMKLTGWQVVCVPGLVPDGIFFEHLANRRFPAGQFIRKADQLDYIEEPDIFHDVFGHVPMLAHPIFADYMQAFGAGGLRAMGFGMLTQLGRLYWATVEFGLIRGAEGLRIYGSGIVSSKGESLYALESDSPNRIHFDLERAMRTDYRIDDFQQTYMVIDSFQELFDATQQDFAPIYARMKGVPDILPGALLPTDKVHHRGTQAYARSKAAKAG
ncbi:phenylalanine 4-monooxygenase [Hypericibacter sp.]|uniref:phenylalanine 4-monooxygenase n=1 Tax=Hypericibacter sp. TaxID=2705401 RepID=UPI003D6D567E